MESILLTNNGIKIKSRKKNVVAHFSLKRNNDLICWIAFKERFLMFLIFFLVIYCQMNLFSSFENPL